MSRECKREREKERSFTIHNETFKDSSRAEHVRISRRRPPAASTSEMPAAAARRGEIREIEREKERGRAEKREKFATRLSRKVSATRERMSH